MIVQSCVTPPYIIQVQGLRMIVLSSCYEEFLFLWFFALWIPTFDEMIFFNGGL